MYYYFFIYTKDCCSKLFVPQNVRRKNELYLLVEKQNFKLPNRLDLDQSKHEMNIPTTILVRQYPSTPCRVFQYESLGFENVEVNFSVAGLRTCSGK